MHTVINVARVVLVIIRQLERIIHRCCCGLYLCIPAYLRMCGGAHHRYSKDHYYPFHSCYFTGLGGVITGFGVVTVGDIGVVLVLLLFAGFFVPCL